MLENEFNLNKCLYVGQREYATVRYDDSVIDIIGSADATTCHIVLIVDQCIILTYSSILNI